MKLAYLALTVILSVCAACAAAPVKESPPSVSQKKAEERPIKATMEERARLAKLHAVIGEAVDYEAKTIIPIRGVLMDELVPAKEALDKRYKKAISACAERIRQGEFLSKLQVDWCINEAHQMSETNAKLTSRAIDIGLRIRDLYTVWLEKAKLVNGLLKDEMPLYRKGEASVEHENALSDEVHRMFASFNPQRPGSLEGEVDIYVAGLETVAESIDKINHDWEDLQRVASLYFTVQVWKDVMLDPEEVIVYGLKNIMKKK